MGDFKLAHFAVGTLGVCKKFIILTIETGCDAAKFDNRIVKITQHGGIIGNLHGTVVVRILPLVVFGLVAICRNGENDNERRNQSGYFPIRHSFFRQYCRIIRIM